MQRYDKSELNANKNSEKFSPQPVVSIKLWHDANKNKACIMLETKNETRFIDSNFLGSITLITSYSHFNHLLSEDKLMQLQEELGRTNFCSLLF